MLLMEFYYLEGRAEWHEDDDGRYWLAWCNTCSRYSKRLVSGGVLPYMSNHRSKHHHPSRSNRGNTQD